MTKSLSKSLRLFLLWSLALSACSLIDAQQRTHFPRSTGQSKMVQCPLHTDCRSIVQCANQSELKLNPRKLTYCGWRHGLPMVCCAATKARNKLFEADDLGRQRLSRLKENTARKLKNFEICGTRIKQISMYIVGGSHVVSPTKYPWFGSIALVKDESYLDKEQDKVNSNLHHYCGSTILTDRFLISSAHCFPISGVDELDLSNYRIALGDVELSSDKMQIHELEQVIIHPNASADHHYADLALIKLKNPLKFSSRVRPVCLPFLDFGEYADETHDNLGNDPMRNGGPKNEKSDDKSKKEDKEKPNDNSNKFDSPEQDLQLFGFPNPNYQPDRETSFRPALPFYGFANPNYQPNYPPNPDSGVRPSGERFRRPFTQRRYPYRYPYTYNNFYPLRSKRAVQFEDDLYDELFTRPNVKVSIAGYGDTSFMGSRSPVLKEAELMIVNRAKCNELYAKLNSTSLRRGLTSEFVCAADRRLAKELNAGVLDVRTRRTRTKRSIRYWVNYFSERFRDGQEKRKSLNRSGSADNGDKADKPKNKRENTTEKAKNKDKLDKSAGGKLELKKDDEYEKDLVNVLSEEELREKLVGLSDACQGDSGGGVFMNFDVRTYNRTLAEYKSNASMKERLKNQFEPIFEKLDRKGLEGKFYLTSIVAFGIDCGSATTPGVYLNLDYHKRWILDNIDLDGSKFTL